MEKTDGSRLLQMQARFQQRQMQEKEHKLVAMYEAQQARTLTRLTASTISTVAPPAADTPHRQGKVRQMFEERRSKAGIDKSYPLQPIQSNVDRNAMRRPLPNGYNKVATKTNKKPIKPAAVSHSVRRLKPEPMTNGSGDINRNTQLDEASHNAKNNNLYSESKDRIESQDRADGLDHISDNIEDETFPEQLAPPSTADSQSSPPLRTQKVSLADKRSPAAGKPAVRQQRPERTTPVVAPATSKHKDVENKGTARASPRGGSEPATSSPAAPRGSMLRRVPAAPTPSSPQKRGGNGTPRKATASASSPGAAGEPCPICGRSFAPDRLQKHEEICRKAAAKKRKPYDALKHRLAGTEAESFIKQIRKLPTPGKPLQPTAKSGRPASTAKPLNSTWKQKHEDFIRAIRAAKQAQAHVAAGGKLSDLPPPPPSENPDYVQCPHCQRRFNQAAAERHIPKCASYQFNKPNPQAQKKR